MEQGQGSSPSSTSIVASSLMSQPKEHT
jgi:hypothetical protein